MKPSKKETVHRGRIQAQGNGLEESIAWAADSPPTMNDGLKMLEELKNKIPEKEAKIRENEFEKAKHYIEEAGKNGGVQALENISFKNRRTKDSRVDIEIQKGNAFI
jgi:hypothetical protein